MKLTPKPGSLAGLEPRHYELLAAFREARSPAHLLPGLRNYNAVASLLARGLLQYAGKPPPSNGRAMNAAKLYRVTDVGRIVLEHYRPAQAA